jgi:hypothetical protein
MTDEKLIARAAKAIMKEQMANRNSLHQARAVIALVEEYTGVRVIQRSDECDCPEAHEPHCSKAPL